MSFDPPVALPAGYVTGQVIAFATPNDHAVLVSAVAPLPTDGLVRAASADRGVVIGTTSVQLMPANLGRRGLVIQNQSTTATVYISGLAGATADYHSLMIPPGGYYETPAHHVGTGAISAVATAAGTPVYAREF